MSTIFAAKERYVGHAPQLVIKGLEVGEFRGYEQWGLAYQNTDLSFEVIKRVGLLDKGINLPSSRLALGHLRWATHGSVAERNSHPHTGCTAGEGQNPRLVIVHNGIIENYDELKQETQGHTYHSETDSEVASHLLEEQLKAKGDDLAEAILAVFPRLKGLNAIVAACGETLVAANGGSPLVIGEFSEGYLIASDPKAFAPHTNRILFVERDDIAVVRDSVSIVSSRNGQQKPAQFEIVDLF